MLLLFYCSYCCYYCRYYDGEYCQHSRQCRCCFLTLARSPICPFECTCLLKVALLLHINIINYGILLAIVIIPRFILETVFPLASLLPLLLFAFNTLLFILLVLKYYFKCD